MAQNFTFTSSQHKVNEEKTGLEIAEEIITKEIANGTTDGRAIVNALTGAEYQLAIVQQGRLTKALDAAKELAVDNSRLIQKNSELEDELATAQERIDLLRDALQKLN